MPDATAPEAAAAKGATSGAVPNSLGGKVYYYLRPSLAEFFGSLFLAFLMVSVMISMERGQQNKTAVSLSLCVGFTVAVLVNGLGWISGGHFNPAITVGVVLSGGIRWPFAIIYPLVQCFGCFVGACIANGMQKKDVAKGNGGAPQPDKTKHKATGLQVFFIEMILVFNLVLTVLVSTDESNVSPLAAVAIGFAISVGIFTHGQTSGAYQNPALAFGVGLGAIPFGQKPADVFKLHHCYWLGPLAGALLAAVMYKLFFANFNVRWIIKDEAVG